MKKNLIFLALAALSAILIICFLLLNQDKSLIKSETNLDRDISKNKVSSLNNKKKNLIVKSTRDERKKYKILDELNSKLLFKLTDDTLKLEDMLMNMTPCNFKNSKLNFKLEDMWAALSNVYDKNSNNIFNHQRLYFENDLGFDVIDSILNDIDERSITDLLRFRMRFSPKKYQDEKIQDFYKQRYEAFKHGLRDKLEEVISGSIEFSLYDYINIYSLLDDKEFPDIREKLDDVFEVKLADHGVAVHGNMNQSNLLKDLYKTAQNASDIALAEVIHSKMKPLNYRLIIDKLKYFKEHNPKAHKNLISYLKDDGTFYFRNKDQRHIDLGYFNILKLVDPRFKNIKYNEFVLNTDRFHSKVYGDGCDDRSYREVCEKYCSNSSVRK
jgi:hypothetical protein